MKKIFFAFALVSAMLLTMATPTFAQDDVQQRRRPDPAQMAERMTEQMVSRYGLDDTQKASLLALNKEYAGKMPMMGGRPGGPGMRGPRGGGPGMRPDSTKTDMQQRQRPSKEEMEKMRKEMDANREAYNAGVKKIMTDDQYKKYTEDQANMRQRGPREEKR